MVKIATAGRSKRLTLRDVVNHMAHMEQRLSSDIRDNSTDIQTLTHRIDTLEIRINDRIDLLSKKVQALDEDLRATMQDTLLIRRHVGMGIPDDE